jgi:hypothetical protein
MVTGYPDHHKVNNSFFIRSTNQKKFSLGSSAKRMQVFTGGNQFGMLQKSRIKQLLLLARFRYGREQSCIYKTYDGSVP